MIHIHPVPAFSDNYLWVIHDGRHAAAVDPGDAQPVLDYLAANDLAGVFDVSKPYFNLDANDRFRQLGNVRHLARMYRQRDEKFLRRARRQVEELSQ